MPSAIVDRNLFTVTAKLLGVERHRELAAIVHSVCAEVQRGTGAIEEHCPRAAPQWAVYPNCQQGTVTIELARHDSPVVATEVMLRALNTLQIATTTPAEWARVDLAQARSALARMAQRRAS
jgi:hypothetical protein